MSSKPSQATRTAVLERDRYRCVRCGQSIRNSQYSIHHRRLRSHPYPGLHEIHNLITLCGSGTTGCHGWVHAHPKEAYEHGWMVHGWANPEEIPVEYWDNRERKI